MQHTPPCGIVTVEVRTTAGNGVKMSVEDTGEGILPTDLPYIWDRFYRGKDSDPAQEGFGLGLVKELTEAMRGSVEDRSQPREGSGFTIRWPGAL